MKRSVFILITCVIVFNVACDATRQSVDSVLEKPEVQLTEIDMSKEKDDAFYSYFRFINETDVPMLITYLERGYDDVTPHYVDSYCDVVDGISSIADFQTFGECFAHVEIFYNRAIGFNDNYVKEMHSANYGLLNDSLWQEEIIDDNSKVFTFVFTQQMYEDANER